MISAVDISKRTHCRTEISKWEIESREITRRRQELNEQKKNQVKKNKRLPGKEGNAQFLSELCVI